jgi:hypothetical protein
MEISLSLLVHKLAKSDVTISFKTQLASRKCFTLANQTMKLSLVLFLTLIAPNLAKQSKPYQSWDSNQLSNWLSDHHIPHPTDLNTEQLRSLVSESYDSVYNSWQQSDFENWFSNAGKKYRNSPYLNFQNQLGGQEPGFWSSGEDKVKDEWEQWKEKFQGTLRRTYDAGWEKWDDSDLRGWCEG